MHRTQSLLLAATVLTLLARPAAAGPLSLAWDDCHNNGANGSINKMWTCDSNTGDAFRLYASAEPPPGLTRFVGTLSTFDLTTATATLPDWWAIGTCRASTSLMSVPVPDQTTCPDLESLPQTGGSDYAVNFGGPNYARLRVLAAIDTSLAHPVVSGVEHTILRISIDRRRTVQAGAVQPCSRCTTPMCIEFKSVLFDQLGPGNAVTVTANGGQYFAMWQGPGRPPCTAATPTTAPTWGRLKSLYR